MRCRHQERLWKEYLRDPSQWWDFRKTKANPSAPDFKHKLTKESLWMDGCYIPNWVKEDRLGLQETEEPWAMEVVCKGQEEAVKNKQIKMNSNSAGGGWGTLSLQEALPALEDGLLPQPSLEDFACILHKCRVQRDRALALRLHAYMGKSGLVAHSSLGNYLVLMLAEVGSMHNAQQVFDRLVYRSDLLWNSLITGYIKCGMPQNALTLYQKMQTDDSVHPNRHTFLALLKACVSLKDLERGLELHAEVARMGLLEKDLFVGSTLLDMYVECGLLAKAQELFDKLSIRDIVLWNALIGGYAKHGHGKKALKCFEQMQLEGVSPDAVTFVSILKACGNIGATDKGQEIHAEIERKGFLERDLFVGSTLVDMYAKCGSLTKAQEVLDKLPVRDVVSWTALIAGYAEHGHSEEALNCFEKMQLEGITPNAVTLVCSLKACGNIGARDKGREIHAEIERKQLLERDHLVCSTLVDMYAKCGSLAKAQEVFDKLPVRNVVSWTALISGYAEHGQGEEALNCFEQMQLEGVSPDAVTFICSLKACGSIGATDKGLEIHAEIERKGLLKSDHVVGNALVDMYARCGSLAIAQRVFDKLPIQGIVTWNSLIAGYAQLGDSENVFNIFDRMLGEGIKPDLVTFVIVLDVCSQTGLFDKGKKYFEAMSKDYGIVPALEHHTCMVDILGRAGLLDKAVAMIKKLPFCPDLAVWHTVLGACRKWELGKQAFEHAVVMSSIYAGADMEEEANKVEAMRVEKEAWKSTGHCWWIDNVGIVYSV